jgi:phenylalanyl-tRNA synthetase beta chain
MPKIHLKTETFFTYLGKKLELKELEDICFDFGIEVEEDSLDSTKIVFEIPANRYDLLCVEGLTDALGIFLGLKKAPVFHLKKGTEKIVVKKSTKQIRPFVVSAILRNVTLDQDRYESFIDLQDKLHQNICRRRTLVAIGTHDYDTVKGPFIYDALPPKDISFVPLTKLKKWTEKDSWNSTPPT